MSILHLHLLLNHVPVIGMSFVLLLLGAALWRRDSANGKLALWILVALACVTGVVFLTGEPAEDALETVMKASNSFVEPHEEAAEAALIATTATGILALGTLFLFRRRQLPRWLMGSALAVVLGVFGLLGWTANLGGQIRHTEIAGQSLPTRDTDEH